MKYFNSQEMTDLRKQLLQGGQPGICSNCYYEDQFNKISGRQRQLLKSGVLYNNFDLSLRSSPHYELFRHSQNNDGTSNYHPVDLQVDLGNACNSSCIMCSPFSSSKLTTDYVKLHQIEPVLFKKPLTYKSWTHDPALVSRFLDEIETFSNLKYIHFLGGETLYDTAFYKICDRLIDSGLSKNIIVGVTTNGTIYDSRIEKIISSFKEFHLGISIETVTDLNDYIRYPSSISEVLENIDKFLLLRNSYPGLFVNLRITPNIFSIYEIDKLISYMVEHNVTAESCNILKDPAVLKMELMPEDIRQEVIAKLEYVIEKYNLTRNNIINSRINCAITEVIGDVAQDYLTFLKSYSLPGNAEELRHQLVKFLKSFETIRSNSIVEYAPRYKDFLRSYGY